MRCKVLGELSIKAGEALVDGSVSGASKIVVEDLAIGPKAQFHQEVNYYTEEGEIDFNTALVDTEAKYNEDLGEDASDLSLTTIGTKSLKNWLFYILSSFLVILVLHALFRNAFSMAVEELEDHLLKSFGVGLIYLIGIPIAIIAVGLSTAMGRKNALSENVIIQSIGAASGVVVAGAIFTIPALYILELPANFWHVFLASMFGGFLGHAANIS